MSSFLQELGPVAVSHRQEVEEVKRQLNMRREELDCWVYSFLENKKFDVEETVAKLKRRLTMEAEEMAKYEFTDYMHESLRLGIIQVIGNDKSGRTVFYVTVSRDKKEADHRDEKKRTFDLMVSYGTQLRADNKRGQMVLLVNYENASMWSNVDMSLQADVGLRLSKFFPGCVSKVYVCNMGRMLCSLAKPLFSQLPAAFSETVMFLPKSEKSALKLMEFIDEDVLPVALGGKNDCDNQAEWDRHGEVIETYFNQMREAVVDRGLTLKDWELECLELQDVEVARRFSAPSGTDSMVSLMTYGSNWSPTPLDGCLGSFTLRRDSELTPLAEDNEWCSLVKSFPTNMALFFLEELYRWRVAVAVEESAERCTLMDVYAATWKREFVEVPAIDLSNKEWYRFVPGPLRTLYHAVLVVVSIASGLSFLVALLFFLSLTSSVAVTIFLAFFVRWDYIFALFATLILVVHQGTTLCTRAVNVISVLLERKVIPPLDMLGKNRGSAAQLILFSLMVLSQLVSLGYVLTFGSFLMGLQAVFAVGWLFAVVFLLLCHVVLFLDWIPSNNQRQQDEQHSMLMLYLMLDVQESEENPDTVMGPKMPSIIVCTSLIGLTIVFGIVFVVSDTAAFAAVTCVLAVATILTVDFCSTGSLSVSNRSVLRGTVTFASLLWLFLCYSYGLLQYDNTWIVSIATIFSLNVVLVVLATMCLMKKKKSDKKLLRSMLVLFVLITCASCIASFFIVGTTVGVISLVLLVHSSLGILCVRRKSRSIGGSFFFYSAIATLAVSCIVIGFTGAKWEYSGPRSLPPQSASAPLDPLREYHRYPVCALRSSGGFGISDFALLTELVGASNESVFTQDFINWFGRTDIAFNETIDVYGAHAEHWTASRFDSVLRNMTVLTLRNTHIRSSIMTMTVWIGSIALAPLQIFLPEAWLKNIAFLISFLTRSIDFSWFSVRDAIVQYLKDVKASTSNEVVITAWGIAGGIASLVGVESQTQTITFGSPGLLHVLHFTNFSKADYHKHVLAVVSDLAVLHTMTRHDPTMFQRIQCNESAQACGGMDYISAELLTMCDVSGRRHISV
uniref:Uncharacterized protein TCIL3000_4_3500 n=1 Tax=Trypanosoma congolense (strain IL3000) TaxID=1068625 RepID=G0ULJ3_TRYCI|nr:unnamed protein product [Trypanosoma congolense IL3000]